VIIQTSLPDHYAIQCALTHDYAGFAERELRERASPSYPPVARLANVVVSSPDPELAAGAAEAAAAWLRARIRSAARGGHDPTGQVEVVGPAPAPIERLHNRWRWHFLLRAGAAGPLGRVLRGFSAGFTPPAGDIRLALDRDPVALL
jgi:primosomal protein N' (replication factor Y)